MHNTQRQMCQHVSCLRLLAYCVAEALADDLANGVALTITIRHRVETTVQCTASRDSLSKPLKILVHTTRKNKQGTSPQPPIAAIGNRFLRRRPQQPGASRGVESPPPTPKNIIYFRGGGGSRGEKPRTTSYSQEPQQCAWGGVI